mgnify:CR=1 FL=1
MYQNDFELQQGTTQLPSPWPVTIREPCISDEFYDVYSDAYDDTGTPCATLAPFGVFRQILNHLTVTVCLLEKGLQGGGDWK